MITENNLDEDDYSVQKQSFAYTVLSGILADLAGMMNDYWVAVLDELDSVHTGHPNGQMLCIFIFSTKHGVGPGTGVHDKEMVIQLNNNNNFTVNKLPATNTVLFLGTIGGPYEFEFELADPKSLEKCYQTLRKCLTGDLYYFHKPMYPNHLKGIG